MPNQYNAVSLTEETYPHAVGSHTAGGVFPNMVSDGLVVDPSGVKAINEYDSQKPVDATVTRSPQPSASGVGGALPHSVPLTGAFNGGVGSDRVTDRDDAAFGTNTDPYLSSNV